MSLLELARSNNASERKDAIVTGIRLLEQLLKRQGYRGDGVQEMLLARHHAEPLPNIQQLLHANRARNRIVHDGDTPEGPDALEIVSTLTHFLAEEGTSPGTVQTPIAPLERPTPGVAPTVSLKGGVVFRRTVRRGEIDLVAWSATELPERVTYNVYAGFTIAHAGAADRCEVSIGDLWRGAAAIEHEDGQAVASITIEADLDYKPKVHLQKPVWSPRRRFDTELERVYGSHFSEMPVTVTHRPSDTQFHFSLKVLDIDAAVVLWHEDSKYQFKRSERTGPRWLDELRTDWRARQQQEREADQERRRAARESRRDAREADDWLKERIREDLAAKNKAALLELLPAVLVIILIVVYALAVGA